MDVFLWGGGSVAQEKIAASTVHIACTFRFTRQCETSIHARSVINGSLSICILRQGTIQAMSLFHYLVRKFIIA